MKYSLVFSVAASVAVAFPHGPGEEAAVPAAPAASAPPAKVVPASSTTAPSGCKLIASDKGFPTLAQIQALLPKAVARNTPLAKGVGRADFTVAAETYTDVINAVKLAKQYNIRINTIASGHDFLSRNDGPSGIELDVSKLRGLRTSSTFTPSAKGAAALGKTNEVSPVASGQAYATFGAGWSTQTLNNALSPAKLVTIGAAHGAVTVAGGFGQTAGHSPLSNKYGLAADQVVEYKVVTPDGQLRVANKVANPDLFWALRGGGGGTFGVVVEATVKAYPDEPMTYTQWQLKTSTPNSDGQWKAYADLHQSFPDLADKKKVAGYYYIYPHSINGLFITHGGTSEAGNKAIWDPILAKLATNTGITLGAVTHKQYPNYKTYFDDRFGRIDGPKPTCKRELAARHGPGEEMEGMDMAGCKRGLMPMDRVHLARRHGPGEEMEGMDMSTPAAAAPAAAAPVAAAPAAASPTVVSPALAAASVTPKTGADAPSAQKAPAVAGAAAPAAAAAAPAAAAAACKRAIMARSPHGPEGHGAADATAVKACVDQWGFSPDGAGADGAPKSLGAPPGGFMEMEEGVEFNAMVPLDSRLLGAEQFSHPNFTAALKAAAPFKMPASEAMIQGHLVSGGAVHSTKEDNSVNPAWRKAYVHTIGFKVAAAGASVDSLRALAPNSGAYANEAFPFEPNWKQSFWGANYARLSSIKTKYDPSSLLWVTPGINADSLEVRDGRVCTKGVFNRWFGTSSIYPPASDNLNVGTVTAAK